MAIHILFTSEIFSAEGFPIWLIIGLIIYLYQLFFRKDKKGKNAPKIDEKGKDSRPGKTIEDILKELQGQFEDKPAPQTYSAPKPLVKKVETPKQQEKVVMPYSKYEGRMVPNEGRFKEKRVQKVYKKLAQPKISHRAKNERTHSLMKHKEYLLSDERYDNLETNLSNINHGDNEYMSNALTTCSIKDVRKGIILQVILERPQY